jgi:hypothetical protein
MDAIAPCFLLLQRLSVANRMPCTRFRAGLRSAYEKSMHCGCMGATRNMAQHLLGATCMQHSRRDHVRADIACKNIWRENSTLSLIDIHLTMCIGRATGPLMQATKKGA